MEFADVFAWNVLGPWLLGMLFGIFVGATPGLTATMAVALIVPISFYLPPNAGLALIIGVSFTAIFAGDIPATFLRIPGTPASAAATLDGHELAKNGQAGRALSVDLLCSSIGGLVGVALLVLLAPQLARFALLFDKYEYFWLAILGLSMSALVSAGATSKGLMTAALGMLLSTVGTDVVSGTQRFTFGHIPLMGGFDFIPVMIGLFGLSEVLRYVAQPDRAGAAGPSVSPHRPGIPLVSLARAFNDVVRHKWTVLKSSVIGTLVGALPGAGADIAAWAAYGVAQRTSKEPDKFGTGTMEGVVAPTSANNAAIGGAWIPALVFGIPGDAVTAIVLGALLMYDIKPGPLIFEHSAHQVHCIFLIAALTQLLLIPCGYLGIRAFGSIMRLPRRFLMVGVVVFSVVGSYAINGSVFDIGVMAAFGVAGFYLESRRMPLAPLVLGLILGPMVEENFRGGLINSHGSFAPFFTRPISLVLFLILAGCFIAPSIRKQLRRRKRA